MTADDTVITVKVPKTDAEREFLGRLYTALGAFYLQPTQASKQVEDVLDAVTAQALQEPRVKAVAESSYPYEGPELETNVRRFLGEITKNARRLIWAIAEETTERDGVVPAPVLRTRLAVPNDGTLGGWAASIGFAIKRTGLSKPYWRTNEYLDEGWVPVYKMRDEIATAVLTHVNPDGSLKAAD